MSKVIYLLIGPKGSGKSFIGHLIQQHFNIEFLTVEDWLLNLKGDRKTDDPSYLTEVFDIIQKGILTALQQHDKVAFESTGLTSQFDKMLAVLQAQTRVITIGVHADPEVCLERVSARSQLRHIPFSRKEVAAINTLAVQKEHTLDHQIDNDRKDVETLVEQLRFVLDSSGPHLPD